MFIGHEKQWEFLKKSADAEKISHAYLFSGQSALGKKKVALEFVKLLFCKGKEPCNTCISCKNLEKGIHPDFFLLEPQKPEKSKTDRREIKISQIRDLAWKMSLYPALSPLKAAIITDAHQMNQEAQNCLLKTLEEPKGRAVLILLTDRPRLLLDTVSSRMQGIRFFPVSQEKIENHIKKIGLSEKKAKEISLLSFGKPELAFMLSQDPQAVRYQNQKIKELIQLVKSDLPARFQYANNVISQKEKVRDILSIWQQYFRSLLLERAKEGSSQESLPKLRRIIQAIQRTDSVISTTTVNPRLALEVFLMEL
ncbi:ATP-binding protein [Patescibacteria group bacterium]